MIQSEDEKHSHKVNTREDNGLYIGYLTGWLLIEKKNRMAVPLLQHLVFYIHGLICTHSHMD